jgi:NO-binding membrane sensor protein with MHYT domain
MAEVHHFEYGWITPLMAYSLSVLGSLLGLICTARVQKLPTARKRISWLLLAAVAIGGTGIWVMHFMAMIGFGVVGSEIRYDLPTTALSAVVSVVVVGIGLFITGLGKPTAVKIGIGGVITGLGVNAMHYIGMAAMRLDGQINYDVLRVGASIAIAVVAATVALWLSVTVRGGAASFAAAMVMGVAVCGMHYTGMSAMSVQLEEHGSVAGATAMNLIAPIALAVVFVVMGLIYSVLAAPTEEDRAGTAYINARLSGVPAAPNPAWVTNPAQPTVSTAGHERPGGMWAASQQAQPAQPVQPSPEPASASGGPGLGARLAGSGPAGSGPAGSGPAGSGPAGSGPAGYGGANGYGNGASSGGYAAPADATDGPAGLGASLLASTPNVGTPQAGTGHWDGSVDTAHPANQASVEYQHSGNGEPLPQRQPGQPAPNAPRPPTSATLAQQFQNRPRTTQDH